VDPGVAAVANEIEELAKQTAVDADAGAYGEIAARRPARRPVVSVGSQPPKVRCPAIVTLLSKPLARSP
jgi:hypothetical protein